MSKYPGMLRATAAAAAAMMVVGGSLSAQTPVPAPQTPAAPASAAPVGAYSKVTLTAGRSTVLTTDFDISRIAITNPAIADATVVAAREVLIDGKAAGTISLILWGPGGRTQYDLIVEPAITTLQQNLQALFPGEDIQVSATEDATILSGTVSSTNVMLRAGEIAKASAAKRQIINLLQVPGGNESQQVLLQVRFAEVNRRDAAGARRRRCSPRASVSSPARRRSSFRDRTSTRVVPLSSTSATS